MSVSTVANWGASYLVSVAFLSLIAATCRSGAFWICGGLCVVVLAILAAKVPGRDLREIEHDLQPVGSP